MVPVIPKPNYITEKDGCFLIKNGVAVFGDFPVAKNQLCDILFDCGITAASEGQGIEFSFDDSYSEEEYSIEASEDSVTVKAATETGAFYAVQTLRLACQCDVRSQSNELTLPCMTTRDKPRFAYRSFMLDECRHFFGKETVKQTLDMMSLLKLNVFHWHLTDDQGWRIQIKKYPLLTDIGSKRASSQKNFLFVGDNTPYGEGCFYTQEDIKEIVAYANERHITVVPEFDMPGHLYAAIACYPELSCFNENVEVSTKWGIRSVIGCAGKDTLYDFVKSVIDEMCELFPSPYFHIGGDEALKNRWRKCPDCQRKIKENGLKDENALQAYFTNEICKYLRQKGKTVIAWNEVLKSDIIDDGIAVQWWIGNGDQNGVCDWLHKGNKAIISKNVYCYYDYLYAIIPLKKTYEFDLRSIGVKADDGVMGIDTPLWTEYVKDKAKLYFNMYPRLQATAEINWTEQKNKDYEDFCLRLDYMKKIMKNRGITYAPQGAYTVKGLTGAARKLGFPFWGLINPNFEYDKYKKQED